ncbi:MAG TPA: HAD-IA family hydrolase [Vicinamibacteria bacterium]|nr:HAD-IA family hydrolase [Vicinamibacteria bacterium]
MSLPEPASVRALLLDAGGVLVRPSFARVAESLRRHGVAADPATLAAVEPEVKREIDRPPAPGLRTDAERGWHYFNLVLERAGIARSPSTDAALLELKAWHDRHCLWEDVPEGVGAALLRFRAAGLPLAVVSNSNGTLRLLLDRLGFTSAFQVILDSAVEGVEKPDPRLFRRALDGLGADAATALHVGDLYHVDVVGARSAGVRPVLVDEADLYPDADCPRVQSLAELAAHLVPAGEESHFC